LLSPVYEKGEAKMRMLLVSATVMLLAVSAYAESLNEQPAVPHAYYGRDGFWHCDPGYVSGSSGGCEEISNPRMLSVSGRLREFELAEGKSAVSDAQRH
jgi:hypothetical protein